MTSTSSLPSSVATEGRGADEDQLIDAARAGDERAFAELYRLHHGSALRLARRLQPDAPLAAEVVDEAFGAVFMAISAGGGPVGPFRPYLHSSVRNRLASLNRRAHRRYEEPSDAAAWNLVDDTLTRAADQRLGDAMRRAFERLSTRHRRALWAADVERCSHDVIGADLAITTSAVAALAMRARRALREAYVAEFAGAEVHTWVRDRLELYSRGVLSVDVRRIVEDHVRRCRSCGAKAAASAVTADPRSPTRSG